MRFLYLRLPDKQPSFHKNGYEKTFGSLIYLFPSLKIKKKKSAEKSDFYKKILVINSGNQKNKFIQAIKSHSKGYAKCQENRTKTQININAKRKRIDQLQNELDVLLNQNFALENTLKKINAKIY
jgi:septal ring factor EnvC (AmiA/AmiB activator)